MDGITSNQTTVVSPVENNSVNNYGTFNNAKVHIPNAKPTEQVRRDLSDMFLAKAASDYGARVHLHTGARLLEFPDWIVEAEAVRDHGESARNNISPAHQLGQPGVPD